MINPVFCYVSEAGTFGADIEFRENDIPWVKSHWIETDEDLRRLDNVFNHHVKSFLVDILRCWAITPTAYDYGEIKKVE